MPIAVFGNALTLVYFFGQSICCFFAPFEAGIYPGITRTRDFCEFCTTLPVRGTSVRYVRHSYPYPNLLFLFCLSGTHKTIPGVFTPGITLQRTSVTSVGHSYPYPELLEVLYAVATKTRGTGRACLYLPRTSGSFVRSCHNTRKCWEFCKTFTPVTSRSSVRRCHKDPGYG